MTPISGLSHDGLHGYIRLEGRSKALAAFSREVDLRLEVDKQAQYKEYWRKLRNFQSDVFKANDGLYLLSLPQWSAPPIINDGTLASLLKVPVMMDWAGARYWVNAGEDELVVEKLKEIALEYGGHVRSYGAINDLDYPLMSVGLLALHQKLKDAYDPAGILNPGTLLSSP
jgi:glycolate oxidase FAD binding subunit